MKYPQYVHVSPDAPDEFWDPKNGIQFRKEDGIIELKDDLDAATINRYLRFNYIFDATLLKNPPVVETEEYVPLIEKTAQQLILESEKEAVVAEEEVVEEPEDERPECPYCGGKYAPKGLPNHMRFCKDNPENVEEIVDEATVTEEVAAEEIVEIVNGAIVAEDDEEL